MSATYTEDHLIEQPAIQIMEHELGWEVEGERILNVGFWILNGRGRWEKNPRLNPDLPMEAVEGAVFERIPFRLFKSCSPA